MINKIFQFILILILIPNSLYAKTQYYQDGLNLYKNKKFNEAKFKFEQDIVFNPKSEMYKLPAIFVGTYAEQDADLTLRLYHHTCFPVAKSHRGRADGSPCRRWLWAQCAGTVIGCRPPVCAHLQTDPLGRERD